MTDSSTVIRTYKYRLYPNCQQAETLDFLLWQMRTVYDDALNERRWAWERSCKSVSYYEQWTRFKQARKDFPDTIGFLNATSTQQMLRRLDKAFAAFFRRIKKGETPGYPRFKSRSRFKSIEYRYGDGCKLNGNRLYVQRVGEVKVKLHRPVPEGATVKHVVLKRSLGKWYVCLMLEMPAPEPQPPAGEQVGVDVGLLHLLALSAHDASLGLFRQLLAYKAEEAGTRIVAVNPRGTSQACSACGAVVRKSLSVRVHSCSECGLTLDRDVNAARNILSKARTGPSGANVTDGRMRSLRSSPL